MKVDCSGRRPSPPQEVQVPLGGRGGHAGPRGGAEEEEQGGVGVQGRPECARLSNVLCVMCAPSSL